jgi:hypothetical protein
MDKATREAAEFCAVVNGGGLEDLMPPGIGRLLLLVCRWPGCPNTITPGWEEASDGFCVFHFGGM